MNLDLWQEYYDMGCDMDVFGDTENVERQDMSPTTSSGPPAQEPKKRKYWKPKPASCPHCGKELSSATNVKRHLPSCNFQPESSAQGN
ncbi:unnamed protein product [Caenorhabditis nigoni]